MFLILSLIIGQFNLISKQTRIQVLRPINTDFIINRQCDMGTIGTNGY